MIKVYSSVFPGPPEEVHRVSGGTIESWITGQAPGYRRGPCQPISVTLNGRVVPPQEWADTELSASDSVDIRVQPKGDALNVVFPFIGAQLAAGRAALRALTPDIDTGSRGRGQKGSQIEASELRANTARLGQVVPEIFGEYIRYPDYLVPPHRYYIDTKTQALSVLLCVGVGEFDISGGSVKIGDTPLDDIDQVIDYQVYGPGANIAGNIAHENWYSSPEVGATDASAGLRLSGITYDDRTYFGNSSTGSATISGITVGEKWDVGITGSIKIFGGITVTDDPGGDIITGNFQNLLLGMTVHVESSALPLGADDTYVVASINGTKSEITLETTGGSPVTDLNTGSHTMSIDKDGTKYQLNTIVNANQILVERILDNGNPDPDWDVLPNASNQDIEIEWDALSFSASFSGPFAACPEGDTCTDLEIDIFAPQGLGVIDGDSIDPRTRSLKIQYRQVGSSTWATVNQTVNGATRDQLGWTFTVSLGSAIRPEVRVARISDEDVSTTSLDRIEWQALKAKMTSPSSYSDITTLAVTIQGSDKIGNRSENRINLIPKRKLPTLSAGAWGAPVATRSISAAVGYIAKSIGHTDAELALDELDRLDDIWSARGDVFDFAFSETIALNAMNTALRAGMAELTNPDGILRPVRDEPRSTYEQAYSPENMTAPLRRSFQSRKIGEPDGVEVEYIDGTTWATETVLCLLPGDTGAKLDKLKLDGVTDRTRAWRIGMRRRRAQRYRRWSYEFSTELDALNSDYLSYCPLIDDIPGYGKASIMRAIVSDPGGARITVSEPMDWIDGETHVVAYRDAFGDLVGPFTATPGATDFEIVAAIPEPFPDLTARHEPPHVYFGTSARWSFPALITEISPSGPTSVSVQAVNYDSRVYDDDDNAPA